eukprot:Selendium_serpulae@DN6096_c0_g1_i2.p1
MRTYEERSFKLRMLEVNRCTETVDTENGYKNTKIYTALNAYVTKNLNVNVDVNRSSCRRCQRRSVATACRSNLCLCPSSRFTASTSASLWAFHFPMYSALI